MFAFLAWLMFVTDIRADDLTGTWTGEPVLGQLGFIQKTISLEKDGKCALKNDFKSFCGIGAVTPDCDYFWMIYEGVCTVSRDQIIFDFSRELRIRKSVGDLKALREERSISNGLKQTFRYSKEGDSLALTRDGKRETLILTRQR